MNLILDDCRWCRCVQPYAADAQATHEAITVIKNVSGSISHRISRVTCDMPKHLRASPESCPTRFNNKGVRAYYETLNAIWGRRISVPTHFGAWNQPRECKPTTISSILGITVAFLLYLIFQCKLLRTQDKLRLDLTRV